MKSKEEALKHCSELLSCFCGELQIPVPEIRVDELFGSYCLPDTEYKGHQISFTPFYRHTEQRTNFLWDQNNPGWEKTWKDTLEIEFRTGEVEHLDCPSCECSLAVREKITNRNEGIDFARRIMEMAK